LRLNNFIKCYDAPYLLVTDFYDLGDCAGGETYFVGLASSSSANLKIGAYGSKKIFEETTSFSAAKYDRYGMYWHHVKEKCFGFSETPNTEITMSDSISQGSDNRLSWCLGMNCLQNETICPGLKYESEDYRKVVYVRKTPKSIKISDGKRRISKRFIS